MGSAANKRTERIRSMACNGEEIRSEEHVRQKFSICSVDISNIPKKDRAKDVEQFDDIWRTFINKMNKSESRLGAIKDEEKMLAVKK